MVYKAFMHGDEVAVKMVRAANPGRKELLIFKKEVCCASLQGVGCRGCMRRRRRLP